MQEIFKYIEQNHKLQLTKNISNLVAKLKKLSMVKNTRIIEGQ